MSTGARDDERTVDVLVIGGGVAGLSTALGLHPVRDVLLVDRDPSGAGGSTAWAQGGLAVALDPRDEPAQHATDTAVAGSDICDERAVTALVEDAASRVAELVSLGARFDRDADGRLDLGREGGHHRHRIVHAGGDASGAEVARTLQAATRAAGVPRLSGAGVTALLQDPSGRVVGAQITTAAGTVHVHARAVVLATGGLGHLYPVSTNPAGVTGDGLALALRAGAALTDVEFVQFHPTALFTGVSGGQLPLVTETLRGAGAVLRDARGRALMAGRHPLADLAPRDVVARAIGECLTRDGVEHVGLDARHLADEEFARHFPTVLAACRRIGVDPSRQLIPVTPAEHFLCGGIATDRWGRSSVPGLYAVGETAATGVHGANRLASNSLVEGLVFGRRLAARLVLDLPPLSTGEARVVGSQPDAAAAATARTALGSHAGLVRDETGLAAATSALDRHADTTDPAWTVACAVVAAARLRRESRGTHFRRDEPASSAWWRRRIVIRLGSDGRPEAVADSEALPAGWAA